MMTATPPDIHPMGRYTNAEATRKLGLGKNTLNRWVKQGRISPRPQKNSARLMFLGRDLIAIWEGKK